MRLYREVREDERRGNGVSMLFVIRDEQAERDAALGAAVRDALIECSCDNPRILRNLLSGPDVEYILDAIAAALRSPDASAGEAERDD